MVQLSIEMKLKTISWRWCPLRGNKIAGPEGCEKVRRRYAPKTGKPERCRSCEHFPRKRSRKPQDQLCVSS